MYAVIVNFDIVPDELDAFLPQMKANANASLQEPQCEQFDVCWNEGENTVFLYELYHSEEAFQFHLETAHFKHFNETTHHMISGKRITCFSQVHQNTRSDNS